LTAIHEKSEFREGLKVVVETRSKGAVAASSMGTSMHDTPSAAAVTSR
jgi:hypothetical protein